MDYYNNINNNIKIYNNTTNNIGAYEKICRDHEDSDIKQKL